MGLGYNILTVRLTPSTLYCQSLSVSSLSALHHFSQMMCPQHVLQQSLRVNDGRTEHSDEQSPNASGILTPGKVSIGEKVVLLTRVHFNSTREPGVDPRNRAEGTGAKYADKQNTSPPPPPLPLMMITRATQIKGGFPAPGGVKTASPCRPPRIQLRARIDLPPDSVQISHVVTSSRFSTANTNFPKFYKKIGAQM